MKRLIIGLLLLLSLCAPAAAEERINLGTEGYDGLSYCFTLPDGRLVFSGTKGMKGNYQNSRGRLLCLNPDLSLSWDYVDPAEGSWGFGGAQLLKNGLIAAVRSNSPKQSTVQKEICYFTQEGQPTGTPVDIYQPDISSSGATGSCLSLTIIPGDAQTYFHYFMDWEGNILFRLHSELTIGGGYNLLPAEDGLVLAGCEQGYPACAKIMKVDLHGQTLWETVLPTLLPDGNARLEWARTAPDGGFVAWLTEFSHGEGQGKLQRAHAVVKFDRDGRVQWMNRDAFEPSMRCDALIADKDRIVVGVEEGQEFTGGAPHRYIWLNESGQYLGETQLTFGKDEKSYGSQLIPTESGLWVLKDIRMIRDGKNVLKEMDSVDEVLFKLPAL